MERTAVVCGVGSWLPPTVVSNADLACRLDTSDEWIRSRTGIGRRHIVDPGSATSDLAAQAGGLALASAGMSEVDALVLATTTPDHPIPATAPSVAARLGITGGAFDVNAGCSGFVYGLACASSLIGAGLADRVLFIGADTVSTAVDAHDRAVAPLFGDGAGAVVLRAGTSDELGAVCAFDLGNDGTGAHLIRQRAGGSRQRSSRLPAPEGDQFVTMDGGVVFTTAIHRMTASSRAVLERSGRTVQEVDRFVAHQANARILKAVAHQLEINPDRVISNIHDVGNTTAASIPLALADAARAGALQAGQLVLLTAFGAGLTWGSAILTWPAVAVT